METTHFGYCILISLLVLSGDTFPLSICTLVLSLGSALRGIQIRHI